MKTSTLGKIAIANSEALILTPYLCSANVKTVGLGSTRSDIKDLASWPWNKQISIQEACNLFSKSLAKYERPVNDTIRVPLKQFQFDALVSFIYNVGPGGANSTLFRRINNRESIASIREAFMMWVNVQGKKSNGLVNRRLAEFSLYSTGVYPASVSAGLVPLVQEVNSNHKPVYRSQKMMDLRPYFGNENINGDVIALPDTIVSPEPLQTPSTSSIERNANNQLLKALVDFIMSFFKK